MRCLVRTGVMDVKWVAVATYHHYDCVPRDRKTEYWAHLPAPPFINVDDPEKDAQSCRMYVTHWLYLTCIIRMH